MTTSAVLKDRYKVVIDKLEATDGKDVAKYDEIVKFEEDKVAPTITGTEKVGTYKVKVNFSEPLSAKGIWSYTDKDGNAVTLDDSKVTLDATDKKSVTLEVADSTVVAGSTINFTGTSVKDTANNLLAPNPAKVDFTIGQKDTVKPTVTSVNQVSGKKFEITFDKAVTAGTVTVDGASTTVAPKTKNATSDTTFVVTSASALDGLQTVAVSNFVNIDGEAMAPFSKVYTFAKDSVAPKVTDSKLVTVDGAQYLQLTFDKEVTAGTVNVSGSYEKDFVTTSGVTGANVQTKYPAKDETKKVLLVPVASFATQDEAKYDVTLTSTTIKSDSDVTVEATKVAFTKEKLVAENNDVYVANNVTPAKTSNPSELTVTFGGYAIDGETATNAANYKVNGQSVKSVKLTGSGTSYVATLTLNPGQIDANGDYDVTVSGVKVKDSKKVMEAVTKTVMELKENVAPTIKTATLTSNSLVAGSAGTTASVGTVTSSKTSSTGTVSGFYTGSADKNYIVTVKTVDGDSGEATVVTVDGTDINVDDGKFSLGNGLNITIAKNSATLEAEDTFTFTATAAVAAVTAQNPTITLKASEKLSSTVAATALEVYAGTTKLALASSPIAISGDTITIKLAAAVTPAQLATLVVKSTENNNIKDEVGNALDFTSINVAQ